MSLTKQHVSSVVDTYIRAWTQQDPDLIVTIFTENASYHEQVLDAPILTLEGIRSYWISKVVQSQGNIKCQLLSLYVDGETAIVEWDVHFDDLAQKCRKHMREVAILEFEGHLIASLREYWASKSMGQL